ncbi:TPA: Ldh family oxidoreductase [Candidatus Bipolaricaulota bacterium]|nr:Ldh family oxidoreductase [Candidatus Bipolaricaulota bacterium]
MIKVEAAGLRRFCREVLIKVELTAEDAAVVADSLVQANLRGVDTHGVMRLPIYVKRMRMGLIAVRPKMELHRTGSATAILDGGNGPGQVVTLRAMEEAIKMAQEAGAGLVAIKNSNHFGAAAYFAMRALEDDMIGLALSHAEADMIPFGGGRPCLGTNPIAIAVPAGEELPIVLDMATSIVAMGNILLAAKEGRSIPEGWAVDTEGNPTTDPKRARAVRPVGGPKGYGLAVIVDVLSALLTGAAFGVHINRMYDNFSEPQAIGHFVGAIDISRYVPPVEFKKRIDQMIREIKATPPAEGFTEVLLPGEPEFRTEEQRLRKGVPLSEEVYTELATLGEELGVSLEGIEVV